MEIRMIQQAGQTVESREFFHRLIQARVVERHPRHIAESFQDQAVVAAERVWHMAGNFEDAAGLAGGM